MRLFFQKKQIDNLIAVIWFCFSTRESKTKIFTAAGLLFPELFDIKLKHNNTSVIRI